MYLNPSKFLHCITLFVRETVKQEMYRSCWDWALSQTLESGSNRGSIQGRDEEDKMAKEKNKQQNVWEIQTLVWLVFTSPHLLSAHLDARGHPQATRSVQVSKSAPRALRSQSQGPSGRKTKVLWRASRGCVFRSSVCPSRYSPPPRGPGCCRCPGPSSAAWCWPWSSAAAASRCRCSTSDSWWSPTSPRPCRSRCRGSWPSWARPAAAASASAWSRGTWCSGGRPSAGWPGRESNTPQRPLQHSTRFDSGLKWLFLRLEFPAEVKGSRTHWWSRPKRMLWWKFTYVHNNHVQAVLASLLLLSNSLL